VISEPPHETMSLSKKLIRGSVISVSEQALKVVAMFITTPLMVEHLGGKDYGLWIVALTIIAYLQLLDLGVSFSGTRFLGQAIGAGDSARFQETIRTLNYLFNHIALGAILLTLTLGLVIPLWLPPDAVLVEARWIVLALGSATALRFATRIFEVILKSHVRYDLLGAIAIIKTIIQAACVTYFLTRGHGLKTLLSIYILTDLIDQCLLLAFSRRISPDSRIRVFAERPLELAPFLRYSLSAMMANLGQHLRSGVDPLIIGHFSGLSLVPVYSIGSRLLSLFTDVVNAVFGGNFVAAFSQLDGRNDREALIRNFLKATRFSSAFAALGGSAIALFGPPFIERWIGPSFSQSGQVLLILVAPTCVMLAQYPAWSFFYSQNKQQWLATATLAGGAFNAVLSIVLAMKIGFLGVVWATAVELLLVFGLFVPWLIARTCPCGFVHFLWHLLRHAAPFVALGLIFHLLIGEWIVPDYLRIFLFGLAYGVISSPPLLFLTLAAEDRRRLFSRFHKGQS
jgi:O-antigen/teichoic acid export membrane protein